MLLSHTKAEMLKYILRGTAKVWGLVLLIGVPLVGLIAGLLLVAKQSVFAATMTWYGLLFTALGAWHGYTEYQHHQRTLKEEAREAARAAEQKQWEEKALALRRYGGRSFR